MFSLKVNFQTYDFESLTDMHEDLVRNHRNKSVSVIHPRPSGLPGLLFLYVTSDGEIRKSYGNKEPVDLLQL